MLKSSKREDNLSNLVKSISDKIEFLNIYQAGHISWLFTLVEVGSKSRDSLERKCGNVICKSVTVKKTN